jgi:hypothetical protein
MPDAKSFPVTGPRRKNRRAEKCQTRACRDLEKSELLFARTVADGISHSKSKVVHLVRLLLAPLQATHLLEIANARKSTLRGIASVLGEYRGSDLLASPAPGVAGSQRQTLR